MNLQNLMPHIVSFSKGILIGAIVTKVVLYTPKDATEYQFTVIDNCIEVRDYDRTVGTVMLEGKLKQMIDKDNE